MVRGHRITFFQAPELQSRVHQHGFEFSPIGIVSSFGEQSQINNRYRSTWGIVDLRRRIKRITNEIELSLRETPEALTQAGIDVLIIDG